MSDMIDIEEVINFKVREIIWKENRVKVIM